MRRVRRCLLFACLPLALCCASDSRCEDAPAVQWPTPTQSARPWTRWWWHGSAVDQANVSRLLEEYQRVGLGGVEITCIYGVQGNDERNLPYRSQAWVDAVQHAMAEADRRGMGVDMPAGSGWRMGGPNLPMELANSRLVVESRQVVGPQSIEMTITKATPLAAVARSADGRVVDLSAEIASGKLSWDAPAGKWQVATAAYRWAGDRVKRPGPGGEGLNINPFWRRSVEAFLDDFDSTVQQLPGIRAQFHDSFEYEGDWQPDFFAEFENRRGYRLQDYLPELDGVGHAEVIARIKADCRETLAELVLDSLVRPWVEWSHQRGMLARNQSHGSPANWLDLYAACDIPETESFGRLVGGDADHLVLKFASSAANVAGRQLVSAESATWLDEHFHVTLAQIKQILDRQMLAGVNHVFYHGTAYSPQDAAWPGWLFYASTQLNPQNPVWRDLPALNQYVTRCQSVLQASRPENDLLLYWPLHDTWHDATGLRMELRVHNAKDWLLKQPLGQSATQLNEQGYSFDYVSDRQIANCQPKHGMVHAPGGDYRAILVPGAERMPRATIERLADLAEAGCHVLFWRQQPNSLPGLMGHEGYEPAKEAQAAFRAAKQRLSVTARTSEALDELTEEAASAPKPGLLILASPPFANVTSKERFT